MGKKNNGKQKAKVLEEVPEEPEPDPEEEYYDYSAEEAEEAAANGYAAAGDGAVDNSWGVPAAPGGGFDAWGVPQTNPAEKPPAADGWPKTAGAQTGAGGWNAASAQPAAGGWTTTSTTAQWGSAQANPAVAQAQHAASLAASLAAAAAAKGKKSGADKSMPAWQSWSAEAASVNGDAWTQNAGYAQRPGKKGAQSQAWESWGKETKGSGGDQWGRSVSANDGWSKAAGGNSWGQAAGGGAYGGKPAGNDAWAASGGWGNSAGSHGAAAAWGDPQATQWSDWGAADDKAGAWGHSASQGGWGYDNAKPAKKSKKSQPYQQQPSKKGKSKKDNKADAWGGGGWDDGGWAAGAGGWENEDSEDDYSTDSEEDRRVHFTPISTSIWGGSQHESAYHMPSRTLAHAYEGTTNATPLFNGPPRNKISEDADLSFIDSKGAALVVAHQALFGHKKRRAQDRIHWMFPPNKDERVSSLLSWISVMADHLAAYGLHRFLQSRERGALIANADFRPPNHPNEPAFDWLTFDQLQPSRDKILQESVALYDPAATTLVFVFLPSKSGNSLAIWRRKIPIRPSLRTSRISEISLALAGLRKEKEYYVLVDELPHGKKAGDTGKSKTTTAPAKSALKYDYGKSYYGYEPYEKKQKKKRKWWNIFG
uniref:CcmS related domain-containing protein n=1 Tax=Mycena chlorophos TaxID=658473 RepID=A0ABQ0LSF1_MYCCL|nr:predicted protein [Mycena chlorophos]